MRSKGIAVSLIVVGFIGAVRADAQGLAAEIPTTMVVGFADDQPPFQFVNELGTPTGFTVELIKAIAQVVGLNVDFRVAQPEELRHALRTNDVHVVVAETRADRKRTEFAYSEPFLRLAYIVFVPRGDEPINSLQELEGKRIVLENGSPLENVLTREPREHNLVLVPSGGEALRRLSAGRADCAIVPLEVGHLVAHFQNIPDIKPSDRAVYHSSLSFAVQPRHRPLLNRLEQGLAVVRRTGQYQQLYNSWIGAAATPSVPTRYIVRTIAVAAGIVIVIALVGLLWSRSLRRQVASRTQELEDAIAEQMRLQNRLQQTQKMEALGALASGIAHDFNNLLSAIFGFTEIIKEQLPADSPVQSDVDEIARAGRRAKELVDQILTFSRRGEINRRPLSIKPVLTEGLSMLNRSWPTNITIEERIAPDCNLIYADPTQIHQIILNLGTNAYHAMRSRGGTLTVTAENVELDEEMEVATGVLRAGRYVVIVFADTGEGIDEATMARIFEPYFSTKGFQEGTGLGLATVHGIVTSHGGGIAVHSELGKGTRFEVYLPTYEGPLEDEWSRGHILFVDDEEAILRLGVTILEEAEYRVTACRDAEHALEKFREDARAFDLVITDQRMPKLTGLELTEAIKQLRGDTPVILCSGLKEYQNSRVQAGKGQFVAILDKPLTKGKLLSGVEAALTQTRS